MRLKYIYYNKLYLEYLFLAQCAFLNIKPKMCFTIIKDSMISDSLNAR